MLERLDLKKGEKIANSLLGICMKVILNSFTHVKVDKNIKIPTQKDFKFAVKMTNCRENVFISRNYVKSFKDTSNYPINLQITSLTYMTLLLSIQIPRNKKAR